MIRNLFAVFLRSGTAFGRPSAIHPRGTCCLHTRVGAVAKWPRNGLKTAGHVGRVGHVRSRKNNPEFEYPSFLRSAS